MAPVLILIGFMGSGKTAVGERVARELGWRFADTDGLVEDRLGMSVSEVFSSRGESGFRVEEETVVLELLAEASQARGGLVASLGGGAVTNRKVYDRLRREPLVVLLDEDVDTAFDRARGGKRPLASDRNSFKKLYDERMKLYRGAAGIILDTRGKDIEQSAAEVVESTRKRMENI